MCITCEHAVSMSNHPRALLPVVYVAPSRVRRILRMLVTDLGPIQRVDDRVAIASQIRTHLESAHRAPLASLVRALAVQAPQIIRALWVGKDEIAMRCFHSTPPSSPQPAPIEAAILNRLAHMLRLQVRHAVEVGDGAGDLEDSVIGPRGQGEPRDRRAEQGVGAVRHAAEGADVARRHVGVGVDAYPAREPLPLRRPGPVNPLPHRLARLAAPLVRQRAIFYGGYLQMDVDAIEQWPRDAREVALDAEGPADAIVLRIAEVAAGARIHGRGEHEERRIGEAHGGE